MRWIPSTEIGADVPRKGWSELSAPQRKRYTGAARTGTLFGVPHAPEDAEAAAREFYNAGGPLGAGRGHRFGAQRGPNSPPRRAVQLEQAGQGTTESYKELEAWRRKSATKGGPPPWLPRSASAMSTDTVAILAQIDIPPARWDSVELVFLPDNRTVVIVTPKRGNPRTVVLPDATAVSEFGVLMRSPGRLAATPAEQRRLEKAWARKPGDSLEITTSGYRARPRGAAA